MTNYINLNGRKIELSNAEAAELEKKYAVRNKLLSEFAEDSVIKIGKRELFILEHLEDGYSVVISRNSICDDTVFGSNNNYNGSKADEICNGFADEIASHVGAENMKEFELDLTANDGMKQYGTIKRRAALRTGDMQRRYAYKFDGKTLPRIWEWLATAWSTPEHNNDVSVLCVSPDGDIDFHYSGFIERGVRPFCILKSDIFVSE